MSRIKVGIVGSRFAAGLHAKAYRQLPDVEVTAVSAIDNLDNFCSQHNIPDSYKDYHVVQRKRNSGSGRENQWRREEKPETSEF